MYGMILNINESENVALMKYGHEKIIWGMGSRESEGNGNGFTMLMMPALALFTSF